MLRGCKVQASMTGWRFGCLIPFPRRKRSECLVGPGMPGVPGIEELCLVEHALKCAFEAEKCGIRIPSK